MARYDSDVKALVDALPDSVRTAMRSGATSSPEYQRAILYFLQQYHARRLPWSATSTARWRTSIGR